MAHLNEAQCLNISNLVNNGSSPSAVADLMHIGRNTVYYQMEKMHPRDPTVQGRVSRRARPKTPYKLTDQIKSQLEEYVLNHPFCTLLDIIRDLQLNVRSKMTISYWLRTVGIGSYICLTKQYLSASNIQDR